MNERLEKVYTTPSHPGSYSGLDKIRKAANFHVSIKKVRKFLKSKDTYTKYRSARKNFKRNPIIATHIDNQWQGDLAEMGNIEKANDGVRYLLVLIDVVSKQAWIEPLKSKHGPVVLQGIKNVFERAGRKPEKLQTDDGKEFLYKGVQAYLKASNIHFFTLKSDKKAAIAERFIRTIKDKIYRYMNEKNTKRYIDVLQDLVESYNATYHKSIKMAPGEVNFGNEGEVLGNLYGAAWSAADGKRKKTGQKKDLPIIGDFVRISKLKGVFDKGYWGNWTEEIFIIEKIIHSYPYILYKLKDWSSESIEGSFYEYEIQVVNKDLRGFWKVEKILQTKIVRGKKKYLVKWEGYPSSVNSWVDEKDIKVNDI